MQQIKLQGFPPQNEVEKAEKGGYPIVLSPSTSAICNLKCIYCCTNAGIKIQGELKLINHIKVINEFSKMHDYKKYVVIAGMGEPFLDKALIPILEHANDLNINVVVFTNMTMMNKKNSKKIMEMENVSIIGKLNSLNPEIQRSMTGEKKMWVNMDKTKKIKIPKGLKNLIDAGFNQVNNGYTRLGVDIVVTKMNWKDIPAVVSFCNKNSIYPVLDTLIPIGRGVKNLSRLKLELIENKKLCLQLSPLMGSDFIKNEFSGSPCSVFKVGIAYDNLGDVRMCCSDRTESIGNIKEDSFFSLFNKIVEKRKRFLFCNITKIQQDLFSECPMSMYYRKLLESQTG